MDCHHPARPDTPFGHALFFLVRAHFNRFGFSIRRVLTDNDSCDKDGRFRQLLHQQHVKHRFTRPYTPRKNGKLAH
jgi:transposase InsO family protein